MSDLADLIASISSITISKDDTFTPSQSPKVRHYYQLNLLEIPSYFTPLSATELKLHAVQAVLTTYMPWFRAVDGDLLDERLPEDAWTLDIVSRAMVMIIVHRAWERDVRMPACSPADHPCAPFWSRPDGQECKDWGVEEVLGRLRLG